MFVYIIRGDNNEADPDYEHWNEAVFLDKNKAVARAEELNLRAVERNPVFPNRFWVDAEPVQDAPK